MRHPDKRLEPDVSADDQDPNKTATLGAHTQQGQLARLMLEAGPLVVFFVANARTNIFTATAAFMVATTLALVISKMRYKRIPVMPLVSGVFVLFFGALTLYFHEDYFIKIKPTIVNCLFSAILFGGLMFGHPLLRHIFGDVFNLQDRGWKILTFRWAVFFLFLAVINEVVWRNFSTDFWAAFKLAGVMPITTIFAISQVGLIHRYDASGADATEPEPPHS